MTNEQADQILKELEMMRKLKMIETVRQGVLTSSACPSFRCESADYQSNGAKSLDKEGLTLWQAELQSLIGQAITRKLSSSLPSISAKARSDVNCSTLSMAAVSKPRSRKQMVAATKLKSSDGQQAQNELDHLAKYGLIRQIKNEGNVFVDDGSRWLYLKDENVRAHRGANLEVCKQS